MSKYDRVPQELKQVRQWVCWTGDKMPKDPKTGKNAQSNNPDTWADFETACKAVDRFGFSGVGFMFAPPYFGVDLDHCLDNIDFVDEFVETLQSYTEISKSGDGIHIICKGALPSGARRRGGVEMYSEGRYFIVTGNLYNEKYTKIKDCTEPIKILHSKYLYRNAPKAAPRQFQEITMDDQDVIEKARSCRSGALFQLLYSGNWRGIYNSQSEADLALCNHLAFWTQKNEAQMDRIFRSSGLMRDKWDSRRAGITYGATTIARAVADCGEVYEPKDYDDDADIALRFFRGLNGEEKVGAEAPRKQYEMTDTGNAHRFRDKYVGQVKYSFVRKKWFYWTGKVWEIDNSGEIKKLADVILSDIKRDAFAEEDDDLRDAMLKWAIRSASSHAKEAMIHEAKHLEGIPVMPDEMDCFADYLNCQNGIINLRNGELIPHDSDFMMSHIALSEYDPSGAKPTMWLKFLKDITNGDQDLVDYLQKCVGYSLGGGIEEQCAFFLYGLGNNGKSTFLDTISEMMGSYSSNVQPETIMLKNASGTGGGANSDIARLQSARFVTSEEPTEGVRLNEGLVKQLTGGGRITCRFLYGDEFEYSPEFKIWIATNHKPIIRGTDVGIWRRIRLIPFEVNIPKEKVDKNLKYKLRKELPQILKWAVQGYMKWQKEGLEPPACVKAATNEYRVEMDVLASFMSSCVEIDYNNGETVAANTLFSIYTKWANENNEYVMSSRKFFLEITKKLPEKTRTANGIVYKKIRLTPYAKGLSSIGRNYSINDFKR